MERGSYGRDPTLLQAAPAPLGCVDEASVTPAIEATTPRYFPAAAHSQLTSSIFQPSLQEAAEPVV